MQHSSFLITCNQLIFRIQQAVEPHIITLGTTQPELTPVIDRYLYSSTRGAAMKQITRSWLKPTLTDGGDEELTALEMKNLNI